MDMDLKNKTVVVTGGAVGIGYEISDIYLQNGAKLTILLDIDEKQGQEAAKTLNSKHGNNKAIFYKCDVTKDLDVLWKKITNTHKYVDVLVNNAGILNDTLVKKTIDINVLALIEWALKGWEHMRSDKSGKGGTIINLASIYGFRIDQFLPVYQASKFAVMGFTKSLGHEYNYDRSGVRVVAICPGFTKTKLTADPKTWDDQSITEDFSVFIKKQQWQEVDSVGKAALDIFKSADSGTAWLIEGGKPIVEV